MRDTIFGEKIFGRPHLVRWSFRANAPKVAEEAILFLNSSVCRSSGRLRIIDRTGIEISERTHRDINIVSPFRMSPDTREIVVPVAHHTFVFPWETKHGATTAQILDRAVQFYVPHARGTTSYLFHKLTLHRP